MNKIFIVLVLGLNMLLAWCWSNQYTQIQFDNFNIKIKTDQAYYIQQNDQSEYKNISIYKPDNSQDPTQETQKSIIFTSQDKLNLNAKDFANQNMETLKSSIWSYTIDSTTVWSFVCSWNNIIWITKKFTIKQDKQNIYFLQFFFVQNNKWYIISFQSDSQKDISDFEDNLNKSKCIE